MWHFKKLWRDEAGAVLTAEAVLVGTVVVLGTVAGLSTVGHAVNDELQELGFAIRSLDQSYCFSGQSSCAAWTAGSQYIQPDVEASLADLRDRSAADAAILQERLDAYRKGTEEGSADAVPKPKETKKPKRMKRKKQGAQLDETSPEHAIPNDLPAATAPAEGL